MLFMLILNCIVATTTIMGGNFTHFLLPIFKHKTLSATIILGNMIANIVYVHAKEIMLTYKNLLQLIILF